MREHVCASVRGVGVGRWGPLSSEEREKVAACNFTSHLGITSGNYETETPE